MAAFQKYYCLSKDVMEKKHDFSNDSFYILLSNTAPDLATDVAQVDASEIANGGGYTTNGSAITLTESHVTGVYKVTASGNIEWTGASGGFTARYAIMYNYTSAGKQLIGLWDYGSSQAVGDGEKFRFVCDAVDILQLS